MQTLSRLLIAKLYTVLFKHAPTLFGCVCSAREVQLTALSPVLSDLAATLIPIPGLTPAHPLPPTHPQYPSGRPIPSSGSVQQPEPGISAAEPYQISSADVVTVASFKPSVHVMSTKTRPKRIAMLGSDGRTYTFLLKVSTKI
jgi:PI-3-kinase-related kinase SMG-1